MRKFIGILVIFLFACKQTVEKPRNLISPEKMATILSEVFMYQQSNYVAYAETDKVEYEKINSTLITSQGVSIKDFEESYLYYAGNPDLYDKILIDVRTILEQKLPEQERSNREKARSEAEK